jgi:hypothetical protein
VPGDGERYAYRALRGDPLGLLAAGETDVELAQDIAFARTVDGPRPDVLRRVWRAFHGEVEHPAAVLLSLADGYEVGNPALRSLTRLRGGLRGTHGSLTRLASTGVIASTWRDVRDVNTAGAHALLYGDAVDAQARAALAAPADALTAH